MSSLTIGFLGLLATVLLIAIRVPIGIALGSVAFVGIWSVAGWNTAWSLMTILPFNFVGDWSFSAVPMFILMGYLASEAGLIGGLFQAVRVFFGRVPGSLAVSSVMASALFSSASGSSLATAAAMSRIAIPEMLKARYEPGLAAATVAAAGTLGSLIPPSILLLIYGIFAEQSVSKLFVAGVLPGALTAAAYVAMIVLRAHMSPDLAPRLVEELQVESRARVLADIWPFPALVIVILGGIFFGVFSPTESAAVGAFCTLPIAAWKRSLTRAVVKSALLNTLEGTSTIFIIAIGAALFTRFMVLSGVPAFLSESMVSDNGNQLLVIVQISIVYLILGCFIDSIGIMLLTLPVLLPVLQSADVNLIFFGIIMVKLLEIGMITPPVGLNVFVVKSAVGDLVPLTTIFRGATWFICTDLIVLAVLIAFPQIILFLPGLM